MAYTTKVLSGRTYWYKDGKRIAAAKVPASVKSGKKPNGKKPRSSRKNGNGSGRKNGNGRKNGPTLSEVATKCKKFTKNDVLKALGSASRVELCYAAIHIVNERNKAGRMLQRRVFEDPVG